MPSHEPDYTAEIRFGIVMYGGVSLAIYINGVANELFEMACATPREGLRIRDPKEGFTREVYRRVAWLVGNPELRRRYAQAIRAARARDGDAAPDVWDTVSKAGCTRTRLAIDVVAGTSAGGINGVFLAKALANGEQFGALKDLWVNEGDIALLLNDAPSYLDTEPRITDRSAQPRSLLNSDRMYAKLHYALSQMAPLQGVERPPGDAGSPLADEIDLYVTTTDIRGSAVPLRLFDKVVYERRYKQSYHFGYPNGGETTGGNDFAAANVPFLAFAARCTSSFPFAFEPMTLSTLTRLEVAGPAPGVLRWNAFFPGLPKTEVERGWHVDRAFGDGGYLDNKPFTYVVDTLSRRFSAVPMERKLVFVEPSPQQLDPDDPNEKPDPEKTPDALENSLAALLSIPRYETIREDLQAVLARNRRIERIERVVQLGENSVNNRDPFSNVVLKDGKVPAWTSLTLSDMVRYYGTAYLPYQRLRIYAVTDALADRLATACGIDESSDRRYALRALVRVWRERRYDDEGQGGKPTINAFLDEFDFDYRVRRLGFLLRRIDKLTRLMMRRCAGGPLDAGAASGDAPPALSDEERHILADLPPPFTDLPASLTDAQLDNALHALRELKRGLLAARKKLLDAGRRLALSLPAGATIDSLRADLRTVLGEVLGERPGDAPPEVQRADGALTRVVLPPEALRSASATRTLQEAVLFRANALFDAAARTGNTAVQDWLEGGIEAMRVKRAPGSTGPLPDAALASNLAWRLLGSPALDVVGDGEAGRKRIEAVVVDADASGFDAALGLAAALPVLDGAEGRTLRRFLGMYYLRFDTYDQMSFPLYYDTGTGEPSTTEVVRVSPVDATNLIDEAKDPQRRRKLAGTALANFGAFLDRRWRLNDIMWGRLDAVERLVQALLPMTDDDTREVRAELIERAQRSILREALVPDGAGALADLVVKAIDATPKGGSTAAPLQALFDQLWSGDNVARERLAGMLVAQLAEDGLAKYVRETRKTDPEADAKATLKSAARAVTITGRVLESVSKAQGGGKAVPRWLARLGLMMQGIVAVSLPGTLNDRWWTHGVKVLYAFEFVLVVLAFLLGSADMRTLAITAFASTMGVHLLTLMVGDVMREHRNHVLRWVALGLLAAVVALAGVGTLVLVHWGTQQALCGAPTAEAGQEPGLPARACGVLGRFHAWWSAI